MVEEGQRQRGTGLVKRGYSEQEIKIIYELARLLLDNGQIRSAETILKGITEVAPDFSAGWLGLSYVQISNRLFSEAIFSARQALRIDPGNVEALLYLVACFLTTGDQSSAGTYLGELSEKIESGQITHPRYINFFKGQLARYKSGV